MLWEIEIRPRGHDAERARVVDELSLLTHEPGGGLIAGSARGYLLEGAVSRQQAEPRSVAPAELAASAAHQPRGLAPSPRCGTRRSVPCAHTSRATPWTRRCLRVFAAPFLFSFFYNSPAPHNTLPSFPQRPSPI